MKKHINLSSWKGSISDWTELNYIKGGLADEYADIANVKGNYVKKSDNLAVNPTITNNVSSDFNPIITLENLNLKANTTYTISFKNINTLNSGTRYYITATPSISYIYVGANSTKTEYSLTFTTTAITTTLYVRLQYTTGGNTGTTTNVMLNEGSTALPYQPGSTTGLYIEDNVNDELIPINEPNTQATRNTLMLSVSETFDDTPTDDVR